MSAYFDSKQAVFRLSQGNSTFINGLNVAGRGRELPTTIALAMLVAANVPMPGGELDAPEDYFSQTAVALSTEFLGALNEMLPIDYRAAVEIGKRLFLVRYELATCPFNAFGMDRSCGLSSIFGLNAHLASDVVKCMAENGQVITDRYNRFKTIEAELKKG